MLKSFELDKNYLENKYHKTDEEFDPFNFMHYRGYEFDAGTGLTDEEIDQGLEALMKEVKGEPRPIIKAKAVAFVLDNTRIDINEHDYFPAVYSIGRIIGKHTMGPWLMDVYEEGKKEADTFSYVSCLNIGPYRDAGLAWTFLDFDHTIPEWDSLMELGFSGVLERAMKSAQNLRESGKLTEKQEVFAEAIKIEYEAILRFIDRLYNLSSAKSFQKASLITESLKNVRDGAPKTTYDALMAMFLYFIVSECIDHYQVRSLGYGLDHTLYPFYQKDIEAGNFTESEIKEFIAYFLMQFSAMGNYWGQPMYLAGTNQDGSSRVNELSHVILDTYRELGIYNPKIQIKVNKKTPKDFVYKILKTIASGSTSIVLMNEDTIVKSVMRKGATFEEAQDAVISGCYEYNKKAASIDISLVTFNLLKMVSLVFTNGVDVNTGVKIGAETGAVLNFKTFKEFYDAFLTQFSYIADIVLKGLSCYEKNVANVNPSMLFSALNPKCVEKLTDALDGGIENGTGTLVNGFASTVNALMAVDELVFVKKVTTLKELKDALLNNWEGYEQLRLMAEKCEVKFGNGNKKADYYANHIHQFYAGFLSERRNAHGGKYGYELHSARSFIDQGKVTEATPDGRRRGEETSKNMSPAPGTDKNGITALISSVTTMDLSLCTNGGCLDAMLHPSAVEGEEGIDVFYGLLNTFLAKGGAAMHFNIFDAETLRDAQKKPEKYKTLQVRVCGWNALWNNLDKNEQDAYIKRAEGIL